MSRTIITRRERILMALGNASAPRSLSQIVQASERPPYSANLISQVSRELHDLHIEGVIVRTGKPRSYVYFLANLPPPRTILSPPRRVELRPVAPTPAPLPPPNRPRASGTCAETVDEFIARGGRVQRLPSHPAILDAP